MITQPIFSRRFVGRHAELDFLIGAAQAVRDGPMRSVLVVGEGGTGKSRLVREFRENGGIKPVRTVVGRCFDYAQAPYAPVEDILRTLHESDPKVLDRDETLRETLRAFFSPDGEAINVTDASAYRKRKALDAIVEAFRRYSAVQPTAYIFEDIHCSDSATLEVLQHIAATFSGNGALFIVTARPDDPDTKAKVDAFTARFARQEFYTRLKLEGLAESAALEMIESALGKAFDIPAARRREIAVAAGGNPLYIEELLKSTVDGTDAHAIPSNIHLAIEARLAALSGTDLHILRMAAILVRFKPAFLAEVTGEPLERVFESVQKALGLNLLRESAAGGTYSFRHEILRRSVLSTLLPDQEKLMHRTIAEKIEQFPNPRAYVEELALHWWESDDVTRSQQYNKAAGDYAFQKYAFEEAVTYYERAAQSPPMDEKSAGDLQSLLAGAYNSMNRVTASITALGKALHHYDAIQDSEAATGVLVRLSKAHYRTVELDKSQVALVEALKRAANIDNQTLLFDVHTWEISFRANASHDVDAALAAAKRAEPYLGGASPTARAVYHEALAATAWMSHNYSTFARQSQLAIQAAEDSGDPLVLIRQFAQFARLQASGDITASIDLFKRALMVADDKGLRDVSALTIAELAYAQFAAGDLRGAAASSRELLVSAMDFPFVRVLAAIVAASAALELEDQALLSDATDEAHVELARQNPALLGQLLTTHAQVHMAMGQKDLAIARLREAIEGLQSAQYNERALVLVAEWGLCEQFPHAETLLESAASQGTVERGMLALFRAFTRPLQRASFAKEAHEIFQTIGWRLEEASALELLDNEESALKIYHECSARRSIRRLERPGASRLKHAELTSREMEIAALVANGKTNRAIAKELVLSDRTVENHLTSIFSKLGLKSRTELAATWKI